LLSLDHKVVQATVSPRKFKLSIQCLGLFFSFLKEPTPGRLTTRSGGTMG
jgi:hypothetical protein